MLGLSLTIYACRNYRNLETALQSLGVGFRNGDGYIKLHLSDVTFADILCLAKDWIQNTFCAAIWRFVSIKLQPRLVYALNYVNEGPVHKVFQA